MKYSIPKKMFRKIRSKNNVNILIVEDLATEPEVMSTLLDSYDSNKAYNFNLAHSGAGCISHRKTLNDRLNHFKK